MARALAAPLARRLAHGLAHASPGGGAPTATNPRISQPNGYRVAEPGGYRIVEPTVAPGGGNSGMLIGIPGGFTY